MVVMLGSTASRLAPHRDGHGRVVFREIVGDLVVDATDKGLARRLLACVRVGTA